MASQLGTAGASQLEAYEGALQGVRVIDLTQFEAGTSCTETLAWLGAEVIKVEEPTKGDQGRKATAQGADSFYFALLNANKQSVTVNLKHETGREIVRSLIEKSDVFVENFAPGAIERLGLGWDEVRAINPRIIYAQIKGFAPEGPYGKFLSFDMVAQCTGGVVSMTGEEDGPPLRAGDPLGDTGTGIHCALGILAALFQRQRTGRGQRIEVAMQEAATNFGRVNFAARLQAGGKSQPRSGNGGRFSAGTPTGLYRCKGDGPNDYCYIHAKENVYWRKLVAVLGREDLLNDSRFGDGTSRYAHHDEIDAIITAWTIQREKADVMKILGEGGVPVGAVLDTTELSEDPYLRERGTFATVNHPVLGEFTMPVFPVKMSDSKVKVEPAPLLGEHNEKVYGELLGFTPERVQTLRQEKAI